MGADNPHHTANYTTRIDMNGSSLHGGFNEDSAKQGGFIARTLAYDGFCVSFRAQVNKPASNV